MKQITEDYVSFEIAVLLKEKGFDGECDYWYGEYGEICCSPSVISVECWCPSQSLALKWLREVHTICIEVCRNINTFYYSYRVIQGASFVKLLDWSDFYDNYEQAVEAAIKYTLENLI